MARPRQHLAHGGPPSTIWPAYITAIIVAEIGDDADVVGDEDDREPEPRLQAAQRVEHLALHDHVERRHRLVGDDEAGPSASASAIAARWRMPPEN